MPHNAFASFHSDSIPRLLRDPRTRYPRPTGRVGDGGVIVAPKDPQHASAHFYMGAGVVGVSERHLHGGEYTCNGMGVEPSHNREMTSHAIDTSHSHGKSQSQETSHHEDRSKETIDMLGGLPPNPLQHMTFLNHGAFGKGLRSASELACVYRRLCEEQPLAFMDRALFSYYAEALLALAPALGLVEKREAETHGDTYNLTVAPKTGNDHVPLQTTATMQPVSGLVDVSHESGNKPVPASPFRSLSTDMPHNHFVDGLVVCPNVTFAMWSVLTSLHLQDRHPDDYGNDVILCK